VRINVFQNLNRKLSSPKKSSKRSEFTLLKRRRKKEEVKEDPNSMANGSFQWLDFAPNQQVGYCSIFKRAKCEKSFNEASKVLHASSSSLATLFAL
jgi:hypothetical protein